MDAEKILATSLHEAFPPNAVRVSIFDEIMLVKLSIDLNFLSVSSLTYETLGFVLSDPVDFLFYINDTKLINHS